MFESKNITSPIESNEIKLEDFFELLDKKTVENIKNTTSESKARITQDVIDMEKDINMTKEILKSL